MPVRFPVRIQLNFVGSKTSDEDRRIVEASFTILHPLLFSNNGPLHLGPRWGGLVLLGRQVVFCESAA